jgi:hypothetical protein
MKAYLTRLFTRRINRRTYISGVVLYVAILNILSFVSSHEFFGRIPKQYGLLTIVYLIGVSVVIFLIYSLLCCRINDIGGEVIMRRKSPIMTYLHKPFILAGTKHETKYGKPPPPKVDVKALIGL